MDRSAILTDKDRKDIQKELDRYMQEWGPPGSVLPDGSILTSEMLEGIRTAMQQAIELAKIKNKEKFTPKKYRNHISDVSN